MESPLPIHPSPSTAAASADLMSGTTSKVTKSCHTLRPDGSEIFDDHVEHLSEARSGTSRTGYSLQNRGKRAEDEFSIGRRLRVSVANDALAVPSRRHFWAVHHARNFLRSIDHLPATIG
jgi:hypothetical protein